MTGGTLTGRPAPDRVAYWQALDSGRLLLISAAAMLVTAAFAGTVLDIQSRHLNWRAALAFGGFIAFGELLRLALPGGREAAPIAMVGAMAYALLLSLPKEGVLHYNALLVITVSAIGMTVGALPHIAAGRPAGLTGMCTRLITVACVAFIFRTFVSASFVDQPWEFAFSIMALLVILGWLVETMVGALIRADDVGARFSVAMWDEMRLQWPLGLAVGASVIITVFGAKDMGLMELAVFIGPLLVTQIAFRRYAGIRATYLQTVRSLARVTEVAGYVEAGHSRRVSRLAVAVGRGLGLAETGAAGTGVRRAHARHRPAVAAGSDPRRRHRAGIAGRPGADRRARRGSHPRGRRAGRRGRRWSGARAGPRAATIRPPPLGSMIIRAANAFDDMVGSSTDRDRSAAALERMRLDPAEYDGRVVAVLAEVAGRRVPSRL